MQQRPLFKQKRRPTRLIRRTLLVGLGVFALGAVVWQLLPGQASKDTNAGDSATTQSDEIPLTLEAIDTPESTSKSTPVDTTPRTAGSTTDRPPAFARSVSLDSRPNFHIPGQKESLQAIETPESNRAAVGDRDEPPATDTGEQAATPSLEETTITVDSGDTLSTIFEKAGLGYSDVLKVLDLGDEARRLERIRPGDKLVLITDDAEQFAGLKYDLSSESELSIFRRDGDQLVAEITDLPSETRLVSAGGTIKGSLYQSAIATGVPPAQIMQLAEVFGWKVDFLRDVRDGDQFRLIYEVRERDGERLGTGHIVAAEFTNRGEKVQAVRYTSPDGTTGYYEPDGSSLERGFLRYPVEFSRISSNFNPKRLHPIHNTVRPHNGVDLAAPTGTPVKSAASGRVTFVGWKHGYGKVVQVRHDAKHETLYAHLSGFKGNLKRGVSVDKGATIGFVGMTGAATGPHLHYEFKVHGKALDPLKVDLPEANPIASEHRKDFIARTRGSLEELARIEIDVDGEQPVHLAQNEATRDARDD
ncbi:peptidoglycan DD-metalloendopeptidase family protein [Guyparkeria sp. SB14A]|uniref:peptidoglycan DD-metalloendopeptidase family protein n=1 Tax=Guyparkeria sp. SB14A TaxID=2571147 RepID=UPI001FFD1A2D|nr:peptidoglycan DD-metalloendopeptidase family protein [Guyparkeria sp. SB14A]